MRNRRKRRVRFTTQLTKKQFIFFYGVSGDFDGGIYRWSFKGE